MIETNSSKLTRSESVTELTDLSNLNVFKGKKWSKCKNCKHLTCQNKIKMLLINSKTSYQSLNYKTYYNYMQWVYSTMEIIKAQENATILSLTNC